MKIIGSVKDVMTLEKGLARFVSDVSPWIYEDWSPEQIGWIFILDDDLEMSRSLNIAPHCDGSDDREYVKSMTINVDLWDMWEGDAIHDEATGYLNVVGVVGQEYGFSLFINNSLVQQLHNFRRKVQIKTK